MAFQQILAAVKISRVFASIAAAALIVATLVGVSAPAAATVAADPAATTYSTAGYPNAATTGVPAGTVLTPQGGVTVTTPGAVLDARDIRGGVVIAAPNVVIKRSKIHGNKTGYGIYVRSGSVTIYDSEIYDFHNGIGFNNWKAYRVELRNLTQDGAKLGNNVLLQDSWCHEMTPEPGAHADCTQMQSGVVNMTVRHNTIDPRNASGHFGNAAVFIKPDFGPSTEGPVTIDNNLLAGGNYTMFVVDGGKGFKVRKIYVTNNHFVRNSYRYGAKRVNLPIIQSGNVWHDTGAPITL